MKLRSLLWRIGRFIYKYARKENFHSAEKNGEFRLIRSIIKLIDTKEKPIFIDVGAFKGEWSLYVLKQLDNQQKKGKVYAFEPAYNTFNYLKEKLKNKKNILLRKTAFSERCGLKEFFIFGELNGTNSLIQNKNASIHKVNTIMAFR